MCSIRKKKPAGEPACQCTNNSSAMPAANVSCLANLQTQEMLGEGRNLQLLHRTGTKIGQEKEALLSPPNTVQQYAKNLKFKQLLLVLIFVLTLNIDKGGFQGWRNTENVQPWMSWTNNLWKMIGPKHIKKISYWNWTFWMYCRWT